MVEDSAYLLLKIFYVLASYMWGGGQRTSSRDMSVLGWTRRSGSFDTCLAVSITVFGELPTMRIPPATDALKWKRSLPDSNLCR